MNIHAPHPHPPHPHPPTCNCNYCFFEVDRTLPRLPRLVIIESPFAGDTVENIIYARRCVAHSLSLGEAPIASHLLYTQPGILRDDVPEERAKGIAAGLAWQRVASLVAVYMDKGITPGMAQAVDSARGRRLRVEFRNLDRTFGP